VVREGVTNVVRHSRAKSCEIRLTQDDDRIHAEVKDDGRDPHPDRGGDVVGGSGLPGLAERVETSGGHFEAGPLPDGGFALRVSLPLGEGSSPEVGGHRPSTTGHRLADEDGRP
jgi:two-component system sensor histidine kinase DesK